MKTIRGLCPVLITFVTMLFAQNSRAWHFGGVVWYDTNHNSIRDTGEAGVPGVRVEVRTCSNNTLVASTNTGNDGTFVFSDAEVPLGEMYRVCFSQMPAGFVLSPQIYPPPASGAIVSTADESSGCAPCFRFGDVQEEFTLNNAGLVQESGGPGGPGGPPNPPCPGVASCIKMDIHLKGGAKRGNYIWFNSVVKVHGKKNANATIMSDSSTITFSVDGLPVTLNVPAAVVRFDASATSASTIYDTLAGKWITTVPADYSGDLFLAGAVYKIPANLERKIKKVLWCANFSSDTEEIKAEWETTAASFTTFSEDLSALSIKPVDGNKLTAFHNSDQAGTPENFRTSGGEHNGDRVSPHHRHGIRLCLPSALLAHIGDFVWNDVNNNGVQDTGEAGIPNVTVRLLDCASNTVMTTTTDSTGHYGFSVTNPGNYMVQFVPPAGFVFSLPYQGGNTNIDSDADVNTGMTTCFAIAAGQTDLSRDAGLHPSPASLGIRLVKQADRANAAPGEPVTFTYTVFNDTALGFENVRIVDDNGTPATGADDFVVATGATIAAGASATFTAMKTLPAQLCVSGTESSSSAGTLTVEDLGDRIRVTFRQSRDLNDNTYGVNAITWPHGHKFRDLVGSDQAEFQFTDASGKVVLDFNVDYISQSSLYPSGYGTLGVSGGDGKMLTGDASSVLSVHTTLSDNLNQSSAFYGYTVDSPAPEAAFPTWDYVDGYTVEVSKAAFGAAGFGGVSIPYVHNSPAKHGEGRVSPVLCPACVVNTAVVTASAGGQQLTASATAQVCVQLSGPPPTPHIGDFVWNDVNNNGVQDTGEAGIPNVTVRLLDCSGNMLASTTTDASGHYGFAVASAGNYIVQFVAPAGFTFSLPYQGGNMNTDSDANVTTGMTACFAIAAGQTDLSRDAGLHSAVAPPSGVRLIKQASKSTVAPGEPVTFTYTVFNDGAVDLQNVIITDDNGTPGTVADDFVVATGVSITAGGSATFTATRTLPVQMCTSSTQNSSSAGTLTVEDRGDRIRVTFRQSRDLNDNTYGVNATTWPRGHKFRDLVGSDKAEFRFTDSSGRVVLDFYLDYISQSSLYPSGYGTLGVSGGDGKMLTGNAASVLAVHTTLSDSLNQSPAFYGYTVDSPAPEAAFPTWDYVDGYTVEVSKAAFGAAGFGGVSIPYVHNSPAKHGQGQVSPVPCASCVVNTAVVTASAAGQQLTASATAQVCVQP